MRATTAQSLPHFARQALVASKVGTWHRDPERGVFHADETLASIFGFDEEDCEAGVPLDQVARIVHPDDRHLFAEPVEWAKKRGGLLVLEYRIIPRPGVQRWVLVRGLYEPALPGQMIAGGRGIVIDITESMLDAAAESRAFILSSRNGCRQGEGGPLLRASSHALAAFHELHAMGEEGEHLRSAAQLLLFAIGRDLSRDVPRGNVE